MRVLGALVVLFLVGSPLAARIGPGTVIGPENYQQYLEELRRLLDPATFRDLLEGFKHGYRLRVQPTQVYPQHQLLWEATQRYRGTARVGSHNELVGWVAGIPFPEPKSGAELAWDLDRREMVANQMFFWADFILSKGGKVERTFRWNYWNLYYTGRIIPPKPEIPGNRGVVRMKESFLIVKPFDVRGFSYIRIRYEDAVKPGQPWAYRLDDVYSYLPALRRMRRLTGADVCDPVLGSDLIYDDFEFLRQKITPRMTFEMAERQMLVPSQLPLSKGFPDVHLLNSKRLVGAYLLEWPWEVRPIWVLTLHTNDREYPYSRRVVYLEKQRLTGVGYYLNTYDWKGRLYRSGIYWSCYQSKDAIAPYGPYTRACSFTSRLARHQTFMDFHCTAPDLTITPKQFTFRWLLRRAR